MTTRRKQTDWWEILLYGGIFFLLVVFLFELMKLYNDDSDSAEGGLSGLLSSIPTAAANALATIETGLTSLVTSPISWIASIFDAIPTFLANLGNIFISLFSPGTGGILSLLGTGGTATPVNQGNGSSYPATLTGTPSGDGSNSFSYTLGQ